MRGGSLPRGGSLLLLLASSCPVLGSLTLQEAFECQSHPGMIAFEMQGGVLLEGCMMAYILLVLYVLIEEHYVPTLELISTKEVLNIPASLVGCTIMSAGNCIGDLSISLVAMMVSGAEVGTGEVLGACVFDLLCVLGLECILLPPEGLELPKPLMYYFMVWVVLTTSLDAMLFYTSVELTWYMANVMVLAYILFVTYLFFFDSLTTARGASVADALTDESDAQAAAAAAPQAVTGVARTAVGKAKAPPRESSPLLAQSGATAAEAAEQAGPLASEARPSRCGSASRKLLRLLATPPRYLFAHTIVNAHRRVSCCGTQLMFWPLTLLTCVCYSLGMSYLLVTLVTPPRDLNPNPWP